MDTSGFEAMPGVVIYLSVAAVSLIATAIVLWLRSRRDPPKS